MAASLKDIAEWFESGKTDKASFMIVMCDTYDHDDYPVYVYAASQFAGVYAEKKAAPMQRVMEVYDLNKPWPEQAKWRAFNFPAGFSDTSGIVGGVMVSGVDDAPDDDAEVVYTLNQALNLARLWRAGKLIGGDEDAVIFALLAEIERLQTTSASKEPT